MLPLGRREQDRRRDQADHCQRDERLAVADHGQREHGGREEQERAGGLRTQQPGEDPRMLGRGSPVIARIETQSSTPPVPPTRAAAYAVPMPGAKA